MVRKMKMTLIYALTICVCIGFASTTYASDNCKNVNIIIKNNRAQEIKITKLRYYDYDAEKWRSESTWTALKIAPGATRSRTRNLEHVKNDRTKIMITWRYNTGGSSWSSVAYNPTSNVAECHDGITVNFTVN